MANPFLLGPLAAGGLAIANQIANTATTKEKPTSTGKDGDVKKTTGKNVAGQEVNVYWEWDGKSWKEINEGTYKEKSGNTNYIAKSNDPDAESVTSAVRYPADLTVGSESDYVLFEFYEYQPPFQGVDAAIESTTGEKVETAVKIAATIAAPIVGAIGSAVSTAIEKQTKSFASRSLALYNQSATDEKFYKKTSRPSIILYMPEDIATGYRTQWSGKKFGNLTASVLKAAGSDNVFEGIKNAYGGVVKAADNIIPQTTNKIIQETISNITGDSISADDVFASTRGVILNPNVELLFTGHELRNIDLRYKLVPRNRTEAENIKKIINTFRAASLPNFADGDEINFSGGASVSQNFIKIPNLCKVSFMRGGGLNPDVPQYKMMAMVQVGINYTPDGTYATLEDGTMVAYELELQLQETKLIFSEEVEQY